MKFPLIRYDLPDLIGLLKQNTSLLTETPENQLFVSFWVQNGKLKSAEVKKIDGKTLEVL